MTAQSSYTDLKYPVYVYHDPSNQGEWVEVRSKPHLYVPRRSLVALYIGIGLSLALFVLALMRVGPLLTLPPFITVAIGISPMIVGGFISAGMIISKADSDEAIAGTVHGYPAKVERADMMPLALAFLKMERMLQNVTVETNDIITLRILAQQGLRFILPESNRTGTLESLQLSGDTLNQVLYTCKILNKIQVPNAETFKMPVLSESYPEIETKEFLAQLFTINNRLFSEIKQLSAQTDQRS